MTGMEHVIEQAAQVIVDAQTNLHGQQMIPRDVARHIARALADAGHLVAAPVVNVERHSVNEENP